MADRGISVSLIQTNKENKINHCFSASHIDRETAIVLLRNPTFLISQNVRLSLTIQISSQKNIAVLLSNVPLLTTTRNTFHRQKQVLAVTERFLCSIVLCDCLEVVLVGSASSQRREMFRTDLMFIMKTFFAFDWFIKSTVLQTSVSFIRHCFSHFCRLKCINPRRRLSLKPQRRALSEVLSQTTQRPFFSSGGLDFFEELEVVGSGGSGVPACVCPVSHQRRCRCSWEAASRGLTGKGL
jgi:hypothetical protein